MHAVSAVTSSPDCSNSASGPSALAASARSGLRDDLARLVFAAPMSPPKRKSRCSGNEAQSSRVPGPGAQTRCGGRDEAGLKEREPKPTERLANSLSG